MQLNTGKNHFPDSERKVSWTRENWLFKFNVLLTVHRDISVQQEPTGCTIYFQFISIINLYMFRAVLLLIIRRYYSVCIQQLVYVLRLW